MSSQSLLHEQNALPSRVQADIAAHQDNSERLIGWIQLAVLLTFACLYALSRKMAIAYSAVTPTVIALYLAFTLIRLVAAYRFRLNAWILSLSVLMDIGLLYALIWSFPLQYMQPPSFYLKSPTLLYVFIFIALRALRFEVRYVVLAGVAAAVGWLLMVAYVLYSTSDNMITRDYVHYMTSNSILLGAEFDKIVSMLVLTAIIAVAISQARRLLRQAVLEGQAKRNLSRFFAPEIAHDISYRKDDITAGSGDAREAAILNLDLRGFTKLATSQTPQQVMCILADYQRAMVPIIQRNGGSIDKFLGDGILATFGATQPQPDYAARGVRALQECIEAAGAWSALQRQKGLPDMSVNGAIASGRIICGAVGDESRLEYTVIGDAVNLSAKLEKHNKTLGSRAIVAADTCRRAEEQGYQLPETARLCKDSKVGGVEEPMDLVILA